ncbi:serine/arginine repetitive matrix protein 4 isoform X2 [Nerophis ophidion]|uniref:serine/arginine repetitive matrix protein 4 isoform X2 n=1 Tax=Nerophis ophidion TaxID=159077 RepID=UPI002ADFACC3|nr:serine/arginine repetitive matrix protein 4 isoform X2 [Nerophis ophidion]
MQTETSVQLGASLTLETPESAAILQQKQLFEKFWKGTFKAVAMPRPGSVIVASIIARTRLSHPQTPPPPTDDNARNEVTAGSGVPPAGRDSCMARKRRHHRRHCRARSASFDDERSLRPKAKKKKRKSDKSRRRRRRSPSCSLSPLRKKKKKKKNAKKSKRHRYSSKKSKHSSTSFKRKRKEERRHKKRHFVEKSESRQTPGRTALAHNGTNGALVHKSVKTAAKYPSVLSTGAILSSKLLEGTTSSHGGAHDYDSGNDTSSPPSCKTAADGKSAERRRAASQFADKDDVSDSGNSVTSYASLCKTCRDDGLREHVMLGCRVDVMRSSETSGCSQEASESSGRSRSRGRKKKKKKKKKKSRKRRRCRSSGSSRYSGHHSRNSSSVRSYSRLPSYSPARRRRGSVSSNSSRGSYSRYSHDRSRSRRRTSSSRETDVMHKSSRKRRRREFYSPMRKRRKDSPSHLEARRITSARKRPVPYFRRSPSTCSSTSSWSSLFSRGHRFVRSLERSRSRGRSSSSSCCTYRSFSRSSSWNSVFGTQRRGIRRSRH